MYGARRIGTLNEAKMVTASRRAKRKYDGSGTGRGVAPGGPNMRAKTWSLYIPSPVLAVDEAINLAVPEVTNVVGLFLTVDVAVSNVLAVR